MIQRYYSSKFLPKRRSFIGYVKMRFGITVSKPISLTTKTINDQQVESEQQSLKKREKSYSNSKKNPQFFSSSNLW